MAANPSRARDGLLAGTPEDAEFNRAKTPDEASQIGWVHDLIKIILISYSGDIGP